jgi:hypothetical protein
MKPSPTPAASSKTNGRRGDFSASMVLAEHQQF